VADDAEASHAVVETIEAGVVELAEPIGNDTTSRLERTADPARAAHRQAVCDQMTATKDVGVSDQLVDVEPHGRVVRGDHRARADTDEDVDRKSPRQELSKHADVSGPAKAAGAQHESDANAFTTTRSHPWWSISVHIYTRADRRVNSAAQAWRPLMEHATFRLRVCAPAW
jgi:hypothetical protein